MKWHDFATSGKDVTAFPDLAIVVAVLGLSLLSVALNDVRNPLIAPRRPGG